MLDLDCGFEELLEATEEIMEDVLRWTSSMEATREWLRILVSRDPGF
jgi:hypothetical protein